VRKCLPSSYIFYVKSVLRSVQCKVWEHHFVFQYVTCKQENAAVKLIQVLEFVSRDITLHPHTEKPVSVVGSSRNLEIFLEL
jgi:hypothetical protein